MHYLITFPERDRELVVERCGEIHYARLRYLIPALILVGVYFFILDFLLLQNNEAHLIYRIYAAADVFFMLLQTTFGLLVVFARRSPSNGGKGVGMRTAFLYALLNSLWAAVISGAEIRQTGGTSALIITVMTMSALGIFTLPSFAALVAVSVAVFLFTASLIPGGSVGLFSEQMIFLFALMLISLAISRSFFASTVAGIVNTRKLEMLNRELHSMQASLIQKEKFATMGRLSAGIAHEINNPLSFVKSNFSALEQGVGYLMKKHPEVFKDGESGDFFSKFPDLFRDTRDGFRRISEVVDNLRSFARGTPAAYFESYDLNMGIESTLVIARNSYAGMVGIEKSLGNLPKIEARGGEIEQVLMNLLLNAIYAVKMNESGKEGKIGITTWSDPSSVFCEIWDSGPGVDPGIRNRIFDPFFTTKPAGEGMGFGLSLCYEIVVNRHGGSLNLLEGLPTRFRLSLPIRRGG